MLTAAPDVVLAHYGGTPEALTVVLPIVIFTGFMLLERRARQKERERAAEHVRSQVESTDGLRPDPLRDEP